MSPWSWIVLGFEHLIFSEMKDTIDLIKACLNLLNFYFTNSINFNKSLFSPSWYTAIPYRASTGPEQGFPCVVFPHRENPVFITWDPCNENRFFTVGNTTQGKPYSHYRDGFAMYKIGLFLRKNHAWNDRNYSTPSILSSIKS